MWKINRGRGWVGEGRGVIERGIAGCKAKGEREIYLGRVERDKYRRREGGKRTGKVSEKVLRNHTINYTLEI